MSKLILLTPVELEQILDSLKKKAISEIVKEVKNYLADSSNNKNDERYITKKEAAKIASVSESTIDNWRRLKKIPSQPIGGIVRIRLSGLLAFLEGEEK